MISIKAISAIGLTGLGAATVSTDVYLATQSPRAPVVEIAPITEAPPPPKPELPAAAAVAAPAPQPPLEIAPVIIYGRKPTPPPTKRDFVPCTDWQSMASGPASRGVRTLCLRDVDQ